MAHQTAWYVPQRVVIQQVSGNLTIEELAVINQELVQHLDQGIPLIHVIVDVTGVEQYPIQVHQIGRVMKRDQPEREGWTLVVGANSVIRFLSSIVTQFSSLRFRTFDTVELALAFLAEQDTTLNLNVRS